MEGLRLASRALLAQQAGILVTGQNIANMSTPGYTRQVARLEPAQGAGVPVSTATGLVVPGDGVNVKDVERFRNQFLDDAVREQTSTDEANKALQDILTRANAVMGNTNDSPLASALDNFFAQASRAAATADEPSLRQAVLDAATTLTTEFNARAQNLVTLRNDAAEQTRTNVGKINQLLANIADSNVALPVGTVEGNLALDRRDNLVSELSKYLDVQVVTQATGTVAVYQGGVALVFGSQARTLSLTTDPSGNAALRTDSGTYLTVTGGQVGGLLQAQNVQLPTFSANLDAQAAAIMSSVNSLLQNGYALDGAAGSALFSGVGAQDMKVAITDQRRLGLAAASLQSTAGITVSGATFDPTKALSTQAASLVTPPAASGVIRVNGTDVAWDTTMSFNQIMAAIAATGANGKFDVASHKVFLTRNPFIGTGTDVTVTDVSGNLASVFGLATATINKGIPGDGSVAQAVASLATTPAVGTPPTLTLPQSLQRYLSGFAATVASNDERVASSGSLLTALTQERDQYQGVNSDEETMNLMQYQRAYQAAARLATVQDQLLDTLINQMAK